MSSPIGFKNPDWDLSRSKYEETDEYPLMRTPGPVLMILAAYLLFVLKIGPAFMRKREAYKLTTVMLVYNVVQVALSVFLMSRYFYSMYELGVTPKTCYIERDETRGQILTSVWLYFAAKISELLDTVFFVFRKKDNQISFLHLYHHSIMVIGTWCMLKYVPSHSLIFIGFLNSFVHVLMYTYYGLAAFGDRFAKYLTWKKYMTTIQLVQFVMIVFQYITAVRTSECPPPKGVATFVAANTVFILFLFLNFYKQNYNKKGNKKNVANGKVKTNATETLVSEERKVN